ncbi:sugar kinase [Lactobacillus sp. ESL0679]|uniref:sugar kinase n=1 Tax=Lactobacillus sp. ESL0679 TaxID=2983209 RepID=UPI0023F9DD6A|nr:sugar kinase [Lactobacillus sp. ESL0679]MDF7682418.1 sugar kinase [Lactobacillus sp. ESL0679]
MQKVVTFGEMMLRLKPAENQRIIQTDTFSGLYGGAEANVTTSLSLLGDHAQFVSKVPQNAVGQAALGTLRRYGVDTAEMRIGGPRLGIYFFEKGASVRNTSVVYDRAGSSFAVSKAAEYNWAEILQDASYFYFSGITPAVSTEMFQAVLAACQYCLKHDIQVVCDLNYRGKMWSPEKAQQSMAQLMPYVDVCLANDEDFEATLGIKAFDGDMSRGIEQKDAFIKGMQAITAKYPKCQTVASVLRNIHSVEDSEWMALMIDHGQVYKTPIYKMHVWEGVAAGDAFGAGLVHGLLHDFSAQDRLDYAIAASVLKLTISGDLNLVTDAEIRAVMDKQSNMRVLR